MALQSSGQISASNVNTELGRSSTAYFNMNGADERGLAGVASGSYGFNSFYGKSARKATITTVGRRGNNADSGYTAGETYRIGYAASNRANYYHFEGTQSYDNNAFGSIDKTTGLITSGTLYGLVVCKYSACFHFEVVTSRSSNGGWTSVKVYRQGATGTAYTFNRASASKFLGANDVGWGASSGTYRWVFTDYSGGAASQNIAYHAASDTTSKMTNVYNMFEYARANNLDIYADFA